MNILVQWFDASAAKRIARELAEIILTKSPIVAHDSAYRSEKKLEKQHDSAMFQVEKKLAEFKKKNKLNIYTKAQLGSAFKYALIDGGLNEEVSSRTTTWLLLKCK